MKLATALVVALFLAAGAAQAAPIVELTFKGYPAGLTDGNYYVGLAKGDLEGDNKGAFDMWCIDPLHQIGDNEWEVMVLNFDQARSLGIEDLADLQTMAVLGNWFSNTNPLDKALQHAIWSLVDHRALTASEQDLLTKARASVGKYSYSEMRVLVPASDECQESLRSLAGQIMMTGPLGNSTTSVPETSTVWLVGAGLVAASFLARRK